MGRGRKGGEKGEEKGVNDGKVNKRSVKGGK